MTTRGEEAPPFSSYGSSSRNLWMWAGVRRPARIRRSLFVQDMSVSVPEERRLNVRTDGSKHLDDPKVSLNRCCVYAMLRGLPLRGTRGAPHGERSTNALKE